MSDNDVCLCMKKNVPANLYLQDTVNYSVSYLQVSVNFYHSGTGNFQGKLGFDAQVENTCNFDLFIKECHRQLHNSPYILK